MLKFVQRWMHLFALALTLLWGTWWMQKSQSDLLFEDVSFSSGVYDLNSAWGVSWTDYDQDGYLDLFYSNHLHRPSVLFRGLGDGTFEPVSDAVSLDAGDDDHSAAWADYNNDGYPDIFSTAGVHQPDFLLRNSQGTKFQDVTEQSGLAQGDQGRGRSALWADFDLDGLLDLYVVNWNTPNLLYLQDHKPSFQDVSTSTELSSYFEEVSATACDVDDDGDLDLYLNAHNYELANKLFLNLGDGRFRISEKLALKGTNYGSAFADFDNDGDFDLLMARNIYADVILMENKGNNTFEDVTKRSGFEGLRGIHPSWADFDNDGWLDLLVLVAGKRDEPAVPDRLFRNKGDGTFEELSDRSGLSSMTGKSEAAAWGDYDNDGALDIAISRGGGSVSPFGPNQLFRNRGNDNHWLKVQLVGTDSNRDGIGARLRLVLEDKTLTRQAVPFNGMAQNSPLIHFGLGQSSLASRLEVYWPSGRVQCVHAVPSDQVLILQEPKQDEAFHSPPSLLLQPEHREGFERLLDSFVPESPPSTQDLESAVKVRVRKGSTLAGRGLYSTPEFLWLEEISIGQFSTTGQDPKKFWPQALEAKEYLAQGDAPFEVANKLRLRVWPQMWGDGQGQSRIGYVSEGFVSKDMLAQRFESELTNRIWESNRGEVIGPEVFRDKLDVRSTDEGSPTLHVFRVGDRKPAEPLLFSQFRSPITQMVKSRVAGAKRRKFEELENSKSQTEDFVRAVSLRAKMERFNELFRAELLGREADDEQLANVFEQRRSGMRLPVRYLLEHVHLGNAQLAKEVLQRLGRDDNFETLAENFDIAPLVTREARQPTSAQKYRVVSEFSEERLRADFPQEDIVERVQALKPGQGYLVLKVGDGTSLLQLRQVLPTQEMTPSVGLGIVKKQLRLETKRELIQELFPSNLRYKP